MVDFSGVFNYLNPFQWLVGRETKNNYQPPDHYPSNLESQELGHMIYFTAYTNGLMATGGISPTAVTPSSAAYSCGLFIPSGSGSGGAGITFSDSHEYTDIKLSQIIEKKLGAAIVAEMGAFRRAINPSVQVLYRSTDLREFNFAFLLTPSSKKESDTIKKIVKNIRKFAAPEVGGAADWLFISPAEWEINFFFWDGQTGKYKENLNIPRIRRCVLVDISVDFTSQGEWSTFEDGSPVACMLILKFKEMEIIHRGYVEQGF